METPLLFFLNERSTGLVMGFCPQRGGGMRWRGERERRWKDGGGGCEKETKGCRCKVMEYFGSEWAPAVCHSVLKSAPAISHSTTCYYYGLSESERRLAARDDVPMQIFFIECDKFYRCDDVTGSDCSYRMFFLLEQCVT